MALRDLLRPRSLDELIGQHKAKLVARSVLESKTPEHLLLCGPVGTGKTSLALILARMLTSREEESVGGFGEPCWFHLNSVQCRNKDFVQELVRKVAPFDVLKVFVFDEAHSITNTSQTLLLNALERDGKTFYIFCTTEPIKLSHALRSRCRKAFFEELSLDDRVALIQRGCAKLGIAEPPNGLIDEVRRQGLSGPRSIVNALESAVSGVSVDVAVGLEMPDPCARSVKGSAVECLHQRSSSSAMRRYFRLRAKDLCVDCGKRKPLKGQVQCGPCTRDTRERTIARKKKARHAASTIARMPGQNAGHMDLARVTVEVVHLLLHLGR